MKKKCKKCGKEIERNFVYCPYCGYRQKEPDGLLDEIEEFSMPIPFGFFNFDKIFKDLMRQIDEQMREIDKQIKPQMNRGISIKISFDGETPKINIEKIGKEKKKELEDKKILKEIPEIEKLPREEAKTKIKRLRDFIIYEIDLPGIKSIDDVEIKKLENSIEIKAIGKDKVYFKLIPISLPIVKYYFKDEVLYIYFQSI
jgi:BMFP domain-containing protein YqiC